MERWYRRPFNRIPGPNPIRDIDDELRFHIEMRVQEMMAAGETEDHARELALRRFGDMSRPREECINITERRGKRMARADYMNELRQDIAYALRALRRRPGFTIVAVLTLALGIGANSAIFSVVYGVLLQPLPFRNSNELVKIHTKYPDGGEYHLSAPDFMSVVEESHTLRDVVAENMAIATMTGNGEPREVMRTVVSKRFFDILGLPLKSGRTFTDREHTPGVQRVAIVTDAFARQLFGGAAAALGRSITLAGNPYTVVGVTASGAEFPEQTQIYTPIKYDSIFSASTAADRRSEYLEVVGRAKPGMTVAAVDADLKRLGADLHARFPQTNVTVTLGAHPLSDMLFGSVRQPLFVLLGAVGLVLLIACANVANLLLARATTRESELAVRAALGAGRGRLVRQLLTEAIVLSTAGAACGLALAWWGTHALVAAQPADIPRLHDIGINPVVAGFTAIIALVTGLLFGSVPALQSTGARLMDAIRDGGRGTMSGKRSQRLRASVVVGELALAVVLLTSAGLLMRSFSGLARVKSGFDANNASTFRISLQGPRYSKAENLTQLFARLQDEIRTLPGVKAVGGSNSLPMTGSASVIGPFQAEGREVPKGVLSEIRVVSITPGYFDAIGARMLRGRSVEARDRWDAPSVGVVNRAAIARWFPDGDPVGEKVLLGGTPIEIVGVVNDVLQDLPSKPVRPELYLPYEQNTGRKLNIVVRGPSNPGQIASQIRAIVHQLDAQLPVEKIDPLESVIRTAMSRPRFYTSLMILFAGIAISLAMVGIFGVMNYLVSQRSREISVRMALGADRTRVVRMIVGNAMLVAAGGLALGIVGAIGAGGLLRSQLFGIRVFDPITILAVTLLLAVSAALACFLPARRAASLDPGDVLRG